MSGRKGKARPGDAEAMAGLVHAAGRMTVMQLAQDFSLSQRAVIAALTPKLSKLGLRIEGDEGASDRPRGRATSSLGLVRVISTKERNP